MAQFGVPKPSEELRFLDKNALIRKNQDERGFPNV
jgi:hypothetical protein